MSVHDVAEMLHLGEPTVRDDRHRFLVQQMARLPSTPPPGRPSQLTKTPRRARAAVINAGPQAAGSTAGCWNTPMMQDLIQTRCGVAYHPHDLATFLHTVGFASQKARLVVDPLHEAKRLEWRLTEWPRIVRAAQHRQALLLFGDAARLVQGGSLRSTWAPTDEPPEVRTSCKRKGSKVLGRIDSFSGQLCYKTHAGRLNSESSAAFVLDVLSQTRRHVIVMHDGARYHTSQAMQQFFNAHAARLTMEPWPS